LYVLEQIPVEYDKKELLGRIGISRSQDMKAKEREIITLIEQSQNLLEPKAVYTYLEVTETDGDLIRLEFGEKMKSIILADLLSIGQKVSPYVVTIGKKLEDQVSKLKNNMFQALILDMIGNYAIEIAKKNLLSHIKEPLGDCISSFDPGEGTGELFSLEQLAVLFQILHPTEKIGVQLTPVNYMIPLKSIAGIFAATEEEYIGCQHCPKKCETRKTSYIGKYHSKRSY